MTLSNSMNEWRVTATRDNPTSAFSNSVGTFAEHRRWNLPREYYFRPYSDPLSIIRPVHSPSAFHQNQMLLALLIERAAPTMALVVEVQLRVRLFLSRAIQKTSLEVLAITAHEMYCELSPEVRTKTTEPKAYRL